MTAQVQVKLVQGSQPELEASLRDVFLVAMRHSALDQPQAIAAAAAQQLGRGRLVTLEAQRGLWSRYRIAVRVQGMPITIASVELTPS